MPCDFNINIKLAGNTIGILRISKDDDISEKILQLAEKLPVLREYSYRLLMRIEYLRSI